VVAASASDVPAANHLLTQIEGDATERKSELAKDPEKLLEQAKAEWPERMVVVIDTESGFVKVIRTWDGMVLTRSLERAVARSSPYAVAVAAVELLELAGHEPPRHDAPNVPEPILPPPLSPPPLTSDAGGIEPEPVTKPPPKQPVPPKQKLRAMLSAGGLLTMSLGGDVTLLQPTAGLGLIVQPLAGRVWLGLDLHGAAFGARSRTVVPVARDASELEVEYHRTEFGLRISTGSGDASSGLFGMLDGGISFISVVPLTDDGTQVGGRDRLGGWAGVGGGLRYALGEGPGLELSVGAVWLSGSRNYLAVNTPSFEEGPLHLRVAAGIFWASP